MKICNNTGIPLLGGPCCILSSKVAVNFEIRQSVSSIWDHEWPSSSAGANSRAFFPRVKMAAIITEHHISKQVVQILSGNSFLNSHQRRFGFKDSPACGCGAPLESTESFVFYCPRFSHPVRFSLQPVVVVMLTGHLPSHRYRQITLNGKICVSLFTNPNVSARAFLKEAPRSC